MEGIRKEAALKQVGVLHSKGITYFGKRAERGFFFALTLIMLLWGLAEKFGLLGG